MASNTVVQTNVLALNSHRNLGIVGTAKEKASARLSSGYKVNSAADDAAGLAISEKMRAQIRGLDMASKNAQDGISLIQTAEGGLQEVDNMLQRIRELMVQASNDTNEKDDDRKKIDEEVNALVSEIKDMGERVEFNKINILDATTKGVGNNGTITFQIGANAAQSIDLDLTKVDIANLTNVVALTTTDAIKTEGKKSDEISAFITTAENALKDITEARAYLGARQNRLEYTNKSLQVSSENLSSAESRIRDADMGKEMMNLTKANILQQASVSMLAQANQQPQGILQLLQ